MNAVEPGEAIGVGECNPVGHLAAIGGGMQIVALVESPLKRLGKQCADGGFAGPGDSHQNEDHRRQHFSRSPLLTYPHWLYKFFGLPEWAEHADPRSILLRSSWTAFLPPDGSPAWRPRRRNS